ncbi:hypothetical protein LWI28_022488 [Acer negundo]|uniref:Uncharacterized protein n=1 Tax=Acer negundo TaxID=4023 RepID=A0AAD5J7S8_ACENE|nr:hypothetical protein LWI28_022488 [Acer negundo]
MNKLLMVENDRLQKQVSNLVYENGYMRTQLQSASATTTDNSCESVVMSVPVSNFWTLRYSTSLEDDNLVIPLQMKPDMMSVVTACCYHFLSVTFHRDHRH